MEGKKPDPNGYILNDFIYRLQKNRQTNPSLLTLRPMVTAGDREWGGGGGGELWEYGNVLFPDKCWIQSSFKFVKGY